MSRPLRPVVRPTPCTLTAEQLDEVFDPWAFLSRVGVLFERVEGLEF